MAVQRAPLYLAERPAAAPAGDPRQSRIAMLMSSDVAKPAAASALASETSGSIRVFASDTYSLSPFAPLDDQSPLRQIKTKIMIQIPSPQNSPALTLIATYYDACSRGDAEGVSATMCNDVTHWFLAPNIGSRAVHGAEQLGRYWRKVHELIAPVWVVDHGIVDRDEAVIEWSMFWVPSRHRRNASSLAELSGLFCATTASRRSARITARR